METLTAWILGVLLAIAPPEKVHQKNETIDDVKDRYATTAQSMASVIESRGPLFKGKDGAYKTAALMVSITKFESELARDVAVGERRGDDKQSWCYMQINFGGRRTNIWGDDEMKTWTGPDLVADWTKCFAVGHAILQYSLKSCSGLKDGDILSGYTAGVCTPNEKHARHRWNLAQWILRKYPMPENALAAN